MDSKSISHRPVTVNYELIQTVIVYHSGLCLYIMDVCGQ